MSTNPQRTPPSTPQKRKDARPTLTLKGEEFGVEFRTLLNKAAAKQGQTQSAFVADTLTREAQRILKGNPADTPERNPPPPAVLTERLDAQDRSIAALAQEVRRLTDLQRMSFWQRVRILLAPGSTPDEKQESTTSKAA